MGDQFKIDSTVRTTNTFNGIKMMRVVFLAFIAILGLTQAQRTPKPPSPPPGFGPGSGSESRPNGVSFSVHNRESSKVPVYSPFPLKWVYCNGRWKLVDRENCPAVFIDSDFSEHSNFCSTSGSLYGSYSPSTSGFWHYDPSSGSFSYCGGLPCCLCQACCGYKRG